MALRNRSDRYGAVTRLLHWLMALLILTALGLGLWAQAMPWDSDGAVVWKATVFSWHKTLGVAVFWLALARVLWAVAEARPAPVGTRRAEVALAGLVHWLLYGALLAVPLTGWIEHAATEGYAPILWPFGQDLPLVPKSGAVAGVAAAMHWAAGRLLMAALVLHVAGALKHALVDRDGVLARMVSGRPAAGGGPAPRWPAGVALAVWAGVLGGAVLLAPGAPVGATGPNATAAAPGQWTVRDGTVGLAVDQMGRTIRGGFAGWSAEITFDPEVTDGPAGHVRATIETYTITLGSSGLQAKEPAFLDTGTHRTAVFEADILQDGGWVARGTLTLRGVTRPLELPFSLEIAGDTARMQGQVVIDRRDFGVGDAYPDEGTVGFAVTVTVDLVAVRAE